MRSDPALSHAEYSALRQTIASRGTVRMVLVPLTLLGWAAASLVLVLLSPIPLPAVLPLSVLAAGFEAVYALHIGVERIGRYLQVFYEEAGTNDSVIESPEWETTAMAGAPTVAGGGIDPLFSVLFGLATLANLTTAVLPDATSVELTVVGALHLALMVRIIRARVAARGQRARDLAHYRNLKAQGPRPKA
jgi:hypothetical protein